MKLEDDLVWHIINDQRKRLESLDSLIGHSTATAEALSRQLEEANRRTQSDPHHGLARSGVGQAYHESR